MVTNAPPAPSEPSFGVAEPGKYTVTGTLSTAQTTLSLTTNYNMSFHNASGVIGTLDFNGPALVFTGEAEESAKVFIDWIAKQFHGRLEQERKSAPSEIEPTDWKARAEKAERDRDGFKSQLAAEREHGKLLQTRLDEARALNEASASARGSITPENIDEAVEAGQIIERLQRPVYQPLSEESFRAYEAARRRIAILRQIAAAPDEPQRAEPVFEKLAQEAASLLWEIPANAPNTIGLRGFDIAGRIEGAIKDKLAATQSAPPEVEPKKEWLIWCVGSRCWWAADRRGYRGDPRDAGRYTLDEARSICRVRSIENGPPEAIVHEDDACRGLDMNREPQ